MAGEACSHIGAITSVKHPKRRECEECVKIGDQWVHLRTYQTCGVTLCCDDSPNRHATKHARASGHPVIVSANRGSDGCIVILMMRLRSIRIRRVVAQPLLNELYKSIPTCSSDRRPTIKDAASVRCNPSGCGKRTPRLCLDNHILVISQRSNDKAPL